MSRLLISMLLLAFLSTLLTYGYSQEPASPTTFSDAEKEFLAICDEMDAAAMEFWERYSAIEKIGDQVQYQRDHDPYTNYVEQLLDFESRNRGKDVGLLALRTVVTSAAGGGIPENARELGRRKLLEVLPAYANNELLPYVILYFPCGNVDMEIESCLRNIIAAPNASPGNRDYAKYSLAEWFLYMRDTREFRIERKKELDAGAEPRYTVEPESNVHQLENGMPTDRIESIELEAANLLKGLVESKSEFQIPNVKGVDENWKILQVDKSSHAQRPTLAKKAAGLLFNEINLRVGRNAPALEIELVNGKKWSLAEQRGKPVIIQFSFKGCGPCAAMYPDLRELKEEYGERLTILSIMADSDVMVTLDAVESSELTWDVAWDGEKGPLATQWSVRGFPTIYVVGPDGLIAAVGLRDKELRKKIAELEK